jgi:GTP cyclohydrolase I
MESSDCRQNLRNNKIIQESVKKILKEIGEDPEREGLKRTPFRVAKAYEEIFGGYNFEPKDVLNRQFTESCGIIIEGPISFFSTCEHHVLPFYGNVFLAYVPKKYVTGLDKLIKLVEIYAKRLQVQERMTKQIADGLYENLDCLGVMVVVDAKHLCVSSRETRNGPTRTITSEIRGIFMNNPSAKQEVLDLIKIREKD